MLLIAKLDRRELKLALLFNVGLFGAVHHDICYIRVGQQFLKRAKTQQFVDQHLFQCELFAPVKREFQLRRSEEHTSELQSLMRISYAVFCLKKKNTHIYNKTTDIKKNILKHIK